MCEVSESMSFCFDSIIELVKAGIFCDFGGELGFDLCILLNFSGRFW